MSKLEQLKHIRHHDQNGHAVDWNVAMRLLIDMHIEELENRRFIALKCEDGQYVLCAVTEATPVEQEALQTVQIPEIKMSDLSDYHAKVLEEASKEPVEAVPVESSIQYVPYPPPHLKFDNIPNDLHFSNVDPEKMFRSHKEQMDVLVRENMEYMKKLNELSDGYHKIFKHDLELQEKIKVLESQVICRSDFVMKLMNDNTTLEKQNEEFRNKLFALEALEDQIKKFNQEGW